MPPNPRQADSPLRTEAVAMGSEQRLCCCASTLTLFLIIFLSISYRTIGVDEWGLKYSTVDKEIETGQGVGGYRENCNQADLEDGETCDLPGDVYESGRYFLGLSNSP